LHVEGTLPGGQVVLHRFAGGRVPALQGGWPTKI
jgi:hypothetical protein